MGRVGLSMPIPCGRLAMLGNMCSTIQVLGSMR